MSRPLAFLTNYRSGSCQGRLTLKNKKINVFKRKQKQIRLPEKVKLARRNLGVPHGNSTSQFRLMQHHSPAITFRRILCAPSQASQTPSNTHCVIYYLQQGLCSLKPLAHCSLSKSWPGSGFWHILPGPNHMRSRNNRKTEFRTNDTQGHHRQRGHPMSILPHLEEAK